MIKEVIAGIKVYLFELAPGSVKAIEIEEVLKSHARNLYVQVWLSFEEKPDDEDPTAEADNAIYYFDYIYEHGEHPD